MKLETYLNAIVAGVNDMYQFHLLKKRVAYKRRGRQVKAFRERILRMFEEIQECKHDYIRWEPFADGIYYLRCDICGEHVNEMEAYSPDSFNIERNWTND